MDAIGEPYLPDAEELVALPLDEWDAVAAECFKSADSNGDGGVTAQELHFLLGRFLVSDMGLGAVKALHAYMCSASACREKLTRAAFIDQFGLIIRTVEAHGSTAAGCRRSHHGGRDGDSSDDDAMSCCSAGMGSRLGSPRTPASPSCQQSPTASTSRRRLSLLSDTTADAGPVTITRRHQLFHREMPSGGNSSHKHPAKRTLRPVQQSSPSQKAGHKERPAMLRPKALPQIQHSPRLMIEPAMRRSSSTDSEPHPLGSISPISTGGIINGPGLSLSSSLGRSTPMDGVGQQTLSPPFPQAVSTDSTGSLLSGPSSPTGSLDPPKSPGRHVPPTAYHLGSTVGMQGDRLPPVQAPQSPSRATHQFVRVPYRDEMRQCRVVSADDMRQLRSIFSSLDEDGTGRVEAAEVISTLTASPLGLGISPQGKEGLLDFEEMLRVLYPALTRQEAASLAKPGLGPKKKPSLPAEQARAIKDLFTLLDTDQDGLLLGSEVRDGLTRAGYSEDDAEDAFFGLFIQHSLPAVDLWVFTRWYVKDHLGDAYEAVLPPALAVSPPVS